MIETVKLFKTKKVENRRTKQIETEVVVYPCQRETTDQYYYFDDTPFALKDDLKAMKGAHWCGYDKANPRKSWRVDRCRRNDFNLAVLYGENPFARYMEPLEKHEYRVPKTRKTIKGEEVKVYAHQLDMAIHILVRKHCIVAGEMGTGKTLAAFLAMELSGVLEVWYVAPKSALASVQLEAYKWNLKCNVKYFTYEELKKVLSMWTPGVKPPKFVVFDESSRVKTHSSQRAQAAFHLAESMRDAWGYDCYIVLMSGSPAPKSPLDWFFQAEIACPGYIKEGSIEKFRARLAVQELVTDVASTGFNKFKAWKDGNPNICGACGQKKDHEVHTDICFGKYHSVVPMENEVAKLYRRMSGLVMVKLKKDCLDLPQKIYRRVKVKPTMELMRAAKVVQAKAKSAIEQLTLLREMSDGFQYRMEPGEPATCTLCQGNKKIYQEDKVDCPLCSGTGRTKTEKRSIIPVSSPKLDALTNLLEEVEDHGRVIIYAGFTASLDRICEHVTKLGWKFIRVDGRGWTNNYRPADDRLQMLREFQDGETDQLAFIGHPGSAGMGITLTAAEMTIYFSNDFNAESRIQSEDRTHRPGSTGTVIVDLLHLPTDELVLNNLTRKRELQSISIGELAAAMDNVNS